MHDARFVTLNGACCIGIGVWYLERVDLVPLPVLIALFIVVLMVRSLCFPFEK